MKEIAIIQKKRFEINFLIDKITGADRCFGNNAGQPVGALSLNNMQAE